MASVFSYDVASFPSSSDHGDQLTQSPRADYIFYSLHPIPDSSLTIELIRLRIELPPKFRLPRVTYNRSHKKREVDEDTEAALHDRVQEISGHTSSRGQSAGAVAKELGLIEQTLRNWAKAASVRIPCRRGSGGRRAVKASEQSSGFSQSQYAVSLIRAWRGLFM